MYRSHIPIQLLEAFTRRRMDINGEDNTSEPAIVRGYGYGETEAIKLILSAVNDIDDDSSSAGRLCQQQDLKS